MEPETIRIISHGITLTAEPFRTITKIDHEITIGIETTTIRTDREIILSYHVETMQTLPVLTI